jgi:hypothetical protein
MQKIKSLFVRNYETDRLVRDEITPGCEWVASGEGVATRKYDGTCCMIRDGELYARFDAKNGRKPPAGFIPTQDPDPITGHWPGWVRCDRSCNQWRWHFEAFDSYALWPDGTYELCGPKINRNPEHYDKHTLVKHSETEQYYAPRTFTELKEWLDGADIEGIVWHHPDGRMCKIKTNDFGLPRYYKGTIEQEKIEMSFQSCCPCQNTRPCSMRESVDEAAFARVCKELDVERYQRVKAENDLGKLNRDIELWNRLFTQYGELHDLVIEYETNTKASLNKRDHYNFAIKLAKFFLSESSHWEFRRWL